ncbi:hypothetical protein ACU8KH_05964 [Lachancea thermotolerans]
MSEINGKDLTGEKISARRSFRTFCKPKRLVLSEHWQPSSLIFRAPQFWLIYSIRTILNLSVQFSTKLIAPIKHFFAMIKERLLGLRVHLSHIKISYKATNELISTQKTV